MKWLEQHWILAIVIVIAVIYIYNAYGSQLLQGGQTPTGATLNT